MATAIVVQAGLVVSVLGGKSVFDAGVLLSVSGLGSGIAVSKANAVQRHMILYGFLVPGWGCTDALSLAWWWSLATVAVVLQIGGEQPADSKR